MLGWDLTAVRVNRNIKVVLRPTAFHELLGIPEGSPAGADLHALVAQQARELADTKHALVDLAAKGLAKPGIYH